MKIKKRPLQIAIDGPIGVGKSSLAFILSRKLGLVYIYTGAMYRTVAFLALANNIGLNEVRPIMALLRKSKIELKPASKPERYTDVYLNNQNITSKLFTPETTLAVAQTSKLKEVRDYLVKIQQGLSQHRSVVMEGRDIGTKVLPKADLKVYLTASLEMRAKRRWRQLKEIGKPRAFAEVLKETKQRDKEDINRKESPLIKASDAWVLDTTNITVSATVKAVLAKLKERTLVG